MSFQQTATATVPLGGAVPVAQESVPVRLAFLRRVYSLFGGAMLVWAATTWFAVSTPAVGLFVTNIFLGNIIGFLLLQFVVFGFIRAAAGSFPLNLVALAAFGVFEGLMTAPYVLFYSGAVTGVDAAGELQVAFGGAAAMAVTQAFVLTATIFGSLTAYALITKKDFSFMRGALWLGMGFVMGSLILAYFIPSLREFTLGTGFAAGVVLLLGGFVLMDTSRIMREWPANKAAGAAAILLLHFVMMFRWVLMLLSNRD